MTVNGVETNHDTRNVAAAPFVLVASIILPLILIPTARWLGRRGEAAAAAAPAQPTEPRQIVG